MRIFLGLTEVGGHYRSLAEALEDLGHACTFVDLEGHRFGYGGGSDGVLVRGIRRLGLWRRTAGGRAPLRRAVAGVAEGALRAALLAWVIPRHDAFVFAFGTSFLRRLELPVLKLLGKRVIHQFHGSDSRPPYVDGYQTPGLDDEAIAQCIRTTARKKKALRSIGRWTDVIIDTPMQGLLHERPFVEWLRVGLPIKPAHAPERIEWSPPADGVVRILHCPSNPRAKGTPHIESMIDRLRQEGLPIEFIRIVDEPNTVVIDALRRCDLVVDQMYADYAMPSLAIEASWFGRPVVIGGYAVRHWERLLPPEWRPPTVYCHPDDMQDEIRRLVVDAAWRHTVGLRCRRFVTECWHPVHVAARYVQLIRGDVPADWWCDPSAIDYLHGCCLPESSVQELVRRVVERGGEAALALADKPRLRDAFCRFSRSAQPDARSDASC